MAISLRWNNFLKDYQVTTSVNCRFYFSKWVTVYQSSNAPLVFWRKERSSHVKTNE